MAGARIQYMGGAPAPSTPASVSGAPPAPPALASNPSLISGRKELPHLYAAGSLTDEEFTAAKFKMLQ